MDRPVNYRDLEALAQPLISRAQEIERFRSETSSPEQVLKLLGMLGDIAQASLQEKKPQLPPADPKNPVRLAQSSAQPSTPSLASKKPPLRTSLSPLPASPSNPPVAYGTDRPEYQGMVPMLQDPKLLDALLDLKKNASTISAQVEPEENFLMSSIPKVEAKPKPSFNHRRTPGMALPILRSPKSEPSR